MKSVRFLGIIGVTFLLLTSLSLTNLYVGDGVDIKTPTPKDSQASFPVSNRSINGDYTENKTSSVLNAPFSSNIKVNENSTENQNEVSAAINDEGVMIAGWNDNREGVYRCAYSISRDGGENWSEDWLHKGEYREAGDPVVAADDAGNLYTLAMSFDRDNETSSLEIAHSKDDGRTWSEWNIVVDSSTTEGMHDKPWMHAVGNGTVYITWTLYGAGDIMFIESNDWGETWSSPKQIGGGQGSCIRTDEEGNIYTSWYSSSILGNNIIFRKYNSSTGNWQSEIEVCSAGSGGSEPRSSPITSLAVDPGGEDVYISWSGEISGSENVWVVHSGDGGGSWSDPISPADDNSGREFMPWISLDVGGAAHVMWTDTRSGEGEIYYANSTDSGSSWSNDIRVTDTSWPLNKNFMGDYQSLVTYKDGTVHVFWCDNRTTTPDPDIYTASAELGKIAPRANFSYSPSDPTVDSSIQFNSTSMDKDGTIQEWLWDFGDGNTSTKKNTTHIYEEPGNYTVTLRVKDNDGISGEIQKKIEVQLLATFDIQLSKGPKASGWNFVSSQLIPEDKDLVSVLDDEQNGIKGNYSRLMYYDAENESWKTYLSGRASHFNSLEEWNRKMGLWIHMTTNDTLTIVGERPTMTNITLQPGENMVGYPSAVERTANKILPSEVTRIGVFNASKEYNIQYISDLSNYTMKPGEGYWIYNSAGHEVEWNVEYR